MRHPDPCARVTFTSRQIKTQMQAHRGLSTPKVSTVLSNVYSGAGLRGFWSGCQPNVARCFIGNACEIGCYDEAKTRLIAAGVPDGPLGHFGASGIAGTVSAIFSTPVDVVKTRLMAQAGGVPTEGVVQYAGVVDCFMRMPAIEGVASLYKGFVPSTCMHNAEARAWTCLWLTRTPACTMLAQSRPLSHAAWRLREPSRSQSPHAKLPGRSCTSSRTSRRSRGFGVRTHEGVRIPLESDLVFLPKTQSVHTFPKAEGGDISPLVKAYCRGQCSRSTSPFRPRSRRLARHRAGMSLRDARPLRAGTYPLDERSSHRIFRCAHAARRSRRRATSRALPIVWEGGASGGGHVIISGRASSQCPTPIATRTRAPSDPISSPAHGSESSTRTDSRRPRRQSRPHATRRRRARAQPPLPSPPQRRRPSHG